MVGVGLLAPLLLMGCTQTPAPTSTTPSSQETKVKEELAQTKDELLTMKVKNAVQAMEKYAEVFQLSTDKNKFVIVNSDNKEPVLTETVAVYDVTKDSMFQRQGEISPSVLTAADVVYEEKIPSDPKKWQQNKRLYVAGMDGSKVVFLEMNAETSGGVCASMWLDENNKSSKDLSSVDISESKPVRKPYTAPQSRIDSEIIWQQKCGDNI